jgi:RTX calcium-binding nonapeptide repeat (4 copies)
MFAPRFTILTVGLCLLGVPGTADAATVRSDLVESEEEGLVGPARFTAAPGERNRLTITARSLGLVFFDRANPIRARGDCRQLDLHRARCPNSEVAQVSLGDGDDFVRASRYLAYLHGGAGDDVLLGGPGADLLFGGGGDDTLRAGGSVDELRGGPGRDRLYGGGDEDTLIDGETDRRAARDRFDGGAGADTLDYGRRTASLRIDLGRAAAGTEDRLRGVESVTAGRGDDRLLGDGRDNGLAGGPGDDVVSGGAGNDIPQGGPGDDRVSGDGGDDVVWGDGGADRLSGGSGHDFMISGEERGGPTPDALDCGDGPDEARSDGGDTLRAGCESLIVFSNGMRVGTQPAIDHDSADFSMDCYGLTACDGAITLTGPDGQRLGAARFKLPGYGVAPVRVPLTPHGADVLRQGAVIQVDLRSDAPRLLQEPGGYQMFLRAGPPAS